MTPAAPLHGRWIGPAGRPLRVALLTLAALAALDWALEAKLARRLTTADFRLPYDSTALLPEYLAWLDQAPARKLYFVGDSTMYGPRLAPAQTIPGQVRAALHAGEWLPANLGTIASKIPDFFYLTARLPARPGELTIYNVNYKNFSDWDLAAPLRFRDFYDPALDRLAGPDASRALRVAAGRSAPAGLGAALDRAVRGHWFFYRNRDWVNEMLLGLHPRKLVKSYYQLLTRSGVAGLLDRLSRRKTKTNWAGTRWDPWAIDTLRRYYDVGPLDDGNPVFRFLAPTARLARERGLAPVFFANPMNRELLDRHQLIDWRVYAENLRRIRAAVEAGGGLFLDYTALVPSDGFQDNDHLTAAGARVVADRLAADCRPLLTGRP